MSMNARLWRNSYRVVGVAGISFLFTLSVEIVRITQFWSGLAEVGPEEASVAVIRDAKIRAIEGCLYLAFATFVATAFCAAAFEYAYRARKRWISALFSIVSPLILLLSGSVAYIPHRGFIENGWTVNLGYVPYIPFFAGMIALLFGAFWRRGTGASGAGSE